MSTGTPAAAAPATDLTGRVAVVTGGSRGIGAAIVSELGRRGSAAEVARAALFLASAHCPFIAGAELVVDGGLSV